VSSVVVSSVVVSWLTTISVVGGVVGVAACKAALPNDGIAASRPITPPPNKPAVTPIAVVRRLRRRSGRQEHSDRLVRQERSSSVLSTWSSVVDHDVPGR
jgi:hypothetical protein